MWGHYRRGLLLAKGPHLFSWLVRTLRSNVSCFFGAEKMPTTADVWVYSSLSQASSARILSIDECVRGIHQLCRLSIRTVSQAIRIDIVVAQRPRLSFLTKSLLTFISLEQNEFCWNMRCRNKRSVWHDECKLRASVAKPTDQGFHRFSIRPTPTLSRLVPILGMAAGGRLVVHLEVTL
jgi:hypothetical protein